MYFIFLDLLTEEIQLCIEWKCIKREDSPMGEFEALTCAEGRPHLKKNTDPPLDGMLSGSELLHAPCDHCGMLIRNMPCAILLSCLSNL